MSMRFACVAVNVAVCVAVCLAVCVAEMEKEKERERGKAKEIVIEKEVLGSIDIALIT